MPRPKRSKVAPSAPTAIFNRPKPSALPSHVSSPTRSSSRTTTNSDDSDGLVKRNRSGKNSKGVARAEIQASGALPVSSDGSSTRRKPIRGKERAELVKAARQPPQGKSTKGVEENENEQSTEDQPEIQVPASFPEEETATLEDEDSRENVFASAMKRPQSRNGFNWRAQGTPMRDSSMISTLGNFKRRARQPSVLGIGRPDESPSLSSLGGLEGGEDSFGGEKQGYANLTMFEDMDDFRPDNESTPYHAGKHVQSVDQHVSKSPSAELVGSSPPNESPELQQVTGRNRQRSSPRHANQRSQLEETFMGISPLGGPAKRDLKRKKSPVEVQVPQSQPEPSSPASVAESVREAFDGVTDGEEEEDVELPQPKRQAVAPPEVWSDTMAPPRSSSPVHSQQSPIRQPTIPISPLVPRGRGRPKRYQATRAAVPASKARTNTNSTKIMTTADLQALLPRRRTKKTYGQFDIHSDESEPSENEDEDELSYMGPRRKTNRAVSGSKSKRALANATKTPKTNARSRATAPTMALTAKAKGKQRIASKTPATGKFVRTYSRRVSDKENEPQSTSSVEGDGEDVNDSLMAEPEDLDDDDTANTSMELSPKAKRKMDKMVEYFKQVDEFQLAFEDITASSSSPKDAR